MKRLSRALGIMMLMAGCASSTAIAGQEFGIRVLSSRPDTVSGGSVLVQVGAPNDSSWAVRLNDNDVTNSFSQSDGSDKYFALLTGLRPGKNTVEIRSSGALKVRLEIADHPLAGPVFSGPHQIPFICQTVENGLGPPMDADCAARTMVLYYYRSTQPVQINPLEAIKSLFEKTPGKLARGFKSYNPSDPIPGDVAQTATSDGRTVNYIVRREIGTINRAVYDIRFLHQPGLPLPTPWTRASLAWNGRLVYLFGGGCGGGHHQGILGDFFTEPEALLALGYATATSTLNICQNTFNDKLWAETLSMVKEHFVKQYGEPVHTIGWGGSGGAMQQHLIAQNYPGLLDGIVVAASFADLTTWATSSSDCSLLNHAFANLKQPWTEQQRTATYGYATWRTCVDEEAARVADPHNCDPSIPKAMIYDRVANPSGVRCDLYDDNINILGRGPEGSSANRTLDNVGVQYGLVALSRGQITAEQFVELNERIGGYDVDGNIVATRTEAHSAPIRLAYQRGLVLTGGGGLSQIPIIDWRSYRDDLADEHVRFQSLVTRSRLIAASGNADNQVILVDPRSDVFAVLSDFPTSIYAQRQGDLVRQMDRWLDDLTADTSGGTLSARISRTRPSDLSDGCWTVDGARIVERATFDGMGRCSELYPSYADPRIAAGGPLTDDVLKCALKPISAADYFTALSADQLKRLKMIFPAGVCDYARPGVGQQVTRSVWQKYPFSGGVP